MSAHHLACSGISSSHCCSALLLVCLSVCLCLLLRLFLIFLWSPRQRKSQPAAFTATASESKLTAAAPMKRGSCTRRCCPLPRHRCCTAVPSLLQLSSSASQIPSRISLTSLGDRSKKGKLAWSDGVDGRETRSKCEHSASWAHFFMVLCFDACSTTFSCTASPFLLRTWSTKSLARFGVASSAPWNSNSSSERGTKNGSCGMSSQ